MENKEFFALQTLARGTKLVCCVAREADAQGGVIYLRTADALALYADALRAAVLALKELDPEKAGEIVSAHFQSIVLSDHEARQHYGTAFDATERAALRHDAERRTVHGVVEPSMRRFAALIGAL